MNKTSTSTTPSKRYDLFLISSFDIEKIIFVPSKELSYFIIVDSSHSLFIKLLSDSNKRLIPLSLPTGEDKGTRRLLESDNNLINRSLIEAFQPISYETCNII